MIDSKSDTPGRVAILLAGGFEEADALFCLNRLRESGIHVSLVSQTSGLVSSRHGVSIRPDLSLEQLLAAERPYRLVLIPGGEQSTTRLLTDPRVHRVLADTTTGGGLVAAMTAAETALFQAGIQEHLGSGQFVPQGEMALDTFSQALVDLMVV